MEGCVLTQKKHSDNLAKQIHLDCRGPYFSRWKSAIGYYCEADVGHDAQDLQPIVDPVATEVTTETVHGLDLAA
jgi:hypothetical protein